MARCFSNGIRLFSERNISKKVAQKLGDLFYEVMFYIYKTPFDEGSWK